MVFPASNSPRAPSTDLRLMCWTTPPPRLVQDVRGVCRRKSATRADGQWRTLSCPAPSGARSGAGQGFAAVRTGRRPVSDLAALILTHDRASSPAATAAEKTPHECLGDQIAAPAGGSGKAHLPQRLRSKPSKTGKTHNPTVEQNTNGFSPPGCERFVGTDWVSRTAHSSRRLSCGDSWAGPGAFWG